MFDGDDDDDNYLEWPLRLKNTSLILGMMMSLACGTVG